MLTFRLGSAVTLTISLAGCLPTEYVDVIPDVPADLRQPVTVPERRTETLRDVGLILTDHVEALEVANGRIVAIDCILTAAEDGAEPDCLK